MIRTALLALAVLAALAGCDKLPHPLAPSSSSPAAAAPSPPDVAVLDLGAVAKALGRDEVFKQQVEAAGRELQQQLSEFSTEVRDRLREEQAKLGDEPSEEQRQQLAQLAANAQRQVQQSQALARQRALEFQTGLAAQFRAEVQPVAAEVARANGARTVLLSNTILWFEPAIDITGKVIDEMRARGARPAPPASRNQAPEGGTRQQDAPAPQSTQ